MAKGYSNSSLKRKIAVSYLVIFLVSASAMLFLYQGIQNIQMVDKTNSAPNIKLQRMNLILTLIYEAENQARGYFLFRDTSDLNKYVKSLNEIGKNIDSLSSICKNNPEQVRQLNTIQTLLSQKKNITTQLIGVNGSSQQDMLYSRALEEIYIQAYDMYASPKIIKENTTVSHDSVYIVSKKGILHKLKNIFSENEVTQKVLSQVVTQESTKADTIIQLGTTPDSIVKTVQNVLSKLKLRENYLRNQSLIQEARLLHSDRILLNKIREIATSLETEELKVFTKALNQSSSVLLKASNAIKILAIISICVIFLFLYLIFHDISRSRKHQLALQDAKQQAEGLMKMKEQFLSNMSHEIRTPLGSIIGFTEQLNKTKLEPTQQQYLTTIRKSSDHLLGLVNDILEISKIEAGKLTLEKIRFNLADLIYEIIHTFSLRAQTKNLQLNCNVENELNGDFVGDPFRIRQVLMNIVGNALKFTEQGHVGIDASVMSRRETRVRVLIKISDTGIGIAPEKQREIFEEFSQADSSTTRKYGGTGLGLSIAKKIVELYKGRIYLKSILDKGSTFSIEIPLELPPVKESITNAKPGIQKNIDFSYLLKLKASKILVVDDDETTLMLVSSLFKNLDIDGETLTKASEVIAKLQQKKYDVLFTDIQMPGMSGIELVKTIRSHNTQEISTIPVVALTANLNIKDQLNSGFTSYLTKPFKEIEFYNKILEILLPGYHSSATDIKVPKQNISEHNEPYSLVEVSTFTVNDTEALKRVVETFTANSLKTIEDIKILLKELNMEGISNCAHKLLPTFRQFKMHEVVNNLEKLERYKEVRLNGDEFFPIAKQTIETAEKIIRQIKKERL